MAKVLVDLAHPRIASDIAKRFDLLIATGEQLFADNHLDAGEIYLDDHETLRAAEAYFLLSEAYKSAKLGHVDGTDEHWTEGSKKAALSTMAVMSFRPLRRCPGVRILHHQNSHVANQILLLQCAGSFLEREFSNLDWEMQRRIFNVFDHIGVDRQAKLRVSSITAYVADEIAGRFERKYAINVERDLLLIDSLILLYDSPLRP